MVFPLPDSLSFEQGAAIPLNYMTAHFALVARGNMIEGESVLVHGAAGGVGTASIQVAKAFGAGRVIAVTSTPGEGRGRHGGRRRRGGARRRLQGHGQGGRGRRHRGRPGRRRPLHRLAALPQGGRPAARHRLHGRRDPRGRVNRLLLNNVSVVGVGWGAYVYTRQGYVGGQWDALLPHLTSGAINPPVGATFDLDAASDALLTLDERRATGKVLLTVALDIHTLCMYVWRHDPTSHTRHVPRRHARPRHRPLLRERTERWSARRVRPRPARQRRPLAARGAPAR